MFLDVISRRNDNFCNILTIFSEIDLCDQISAYLTENDEIKVLSNISEISGKKNIVFKIAEFIKNTHCIKKGIVIRIKKRIPLASGLGGGSSNAAACLKIISKLWKLKLSEVELRNIGSKFGSDINFFLTGGVAIGRNKGDEIDQIIPRTDNQKPKIKLNIENILLVNPKIEISSHEAYSLVKLGKSNNKKFKEMLESIKNNDIKKIASNLYNKLEEGLFRKYPVLERIKSQLFKYNALGALVSGSGATLFGIFENQEELMYAKERFTNQGYWTSITKIDYPLNSVSSVAK